MTILKAIASFIGEILRSILPAIFKETKKPREIKTIGQDKELQNDINKSIEDSIDSSNITDNQ